MIRTALLLGICLMVSSCVNVATNQPANKQVAAELVQRHLNLGVGYLRNGDIPRAKEKLNKALAIDPKNALANSTLGLVFASEGENALAEQYFKKAVRYDSDSAQVRNRYGAFLFSEKRYHEAVEQLSKASENRFYENRSNVFENLGVAYFRLGDVENADYAFSRAIRLNAEQPRALLELGEIRFEQRNYVEARDLLLRHTQIANRSAKSFWLCVRVARIFDNINDEASCIEALEGIFPGSDEYQQYKESL